MPSVVEKIRENHGQMTVEQLVALITPDARSTSCMTLRSIIYSAPVALGKVPVDAKTKLLEGIRDALRDDK